MENNHSNTNQTSMGVSFEEITTSNINIDDKKNNSITFNYPLLTNISSNTNIENKITLGLNTSSLLESTVRKESTLFLSTPTFDQNMHSTPIKEINIETTTPPNKEYLLESSNKSSEKLTDTTLDIKTGYTSQNLMQYKTNLTSRLTYTGNTNTEFKTTTNKNVETTLKVSTLYANKGSNIRVKLSIHMNSNQSILAKDIESYRNILLYLLNMSNSSIKYVDEKDDSKIIVNKRRLLQNNFTMIYLEFDVSNTSPNNYRNIHQLITSDKFKENFQKKCKEVGIPFEVSIDIVDIFIQATSPIPFYQPQVKQIRTNNNENHNFVIITSLLSLCMLLGIIGFAIINTKIKTGKQYHPYGREYYRVNNHHIEERW
jgi:hypothetical protein